MSETYDAKDYAKLARQAAQEEPVLRLLAALRAGGLPEPAREYVFHPARKWRFDLAWPALRLAVECEGGMWVRGRHVRPDGYEEDCRKYNAAQSLGWRVLRFTPRMIGSGEALTAIQAAVENVGGNRE